MAEKLRLQFLGAAGTVTGSRTLLEYKNQRVLVDAGLYQGNSSLVEKNYQELQAPAETIDAIVLTHCHIDHSGLLPRYVKEGFSGKIYCTPATAELLHIQLPDAAHIQEEEFHHLKKSLKYSEPLYSLDDAKRTLEMLEVVHYETWFQFADCKFCFHWAGHILGAASLRLHWDKYKLLFSGDIGAPQTILHKARSPLASEPYLICESTYGAKTRKPEDYEAVLKTHIRHIIDWQSILLIPAFAIGRTQLILFVLHNMMQQGKIPRVPIILDSPMAVKATGIYSQYLEELHEDVKSSNFVQFLESDQITLIQNVEASKQLHERRGPFVLVSASGMCQGGRIVHHLKHRVADSRNVLLFIGYQAESSLGFQILNGNRRVRIQGEETFIQCQLDSIGSFSSHADQQGLLNYFSSMSGEPVKKIFLNHGSQDSRAVLGQLLESKGHEVHLPRSDAIYYLNE